MFIALIFPWTYLYDVYLNFDSLLDPPNFELINQKHRKIHRKIAVYYYIFYCGDSELSLHNLNAREN